MYGVPRYSSCFSWRPVLIFPGGSVVVLLLTLVFCHAVITFTFGMSNLVFWILTCCQCPFPCHQYRGQSITSVVHSHWSSFNEARLSLVESFPSDTLCHKEPARPLLPPACSSLVLYGIRIKQNTSHKLFVINYIYSDMMCV